MIQQEHLQVFDLQLKTKSPLFIGCGKSYTKKEYLYDPNDSEGNVVAFLDEQKFFAYLAQHNLADAYEDFILRDRRNSLFSFLQQVCGIPDSDLQSLIRCRIDAADALDGNHSLKEIQRFLRNSSGQVYIPGSSIKGALRTALLKAILLKSPPQNPDPQLPFDRRAVFEADYFHTLGLNKNKRNPLNSILQGLRVSDSLPIPDENLCLTRKIDTFPNAGRNSINICRECIQPGTIVKCTLTLDQSILRGSLHAEDLRQAIAAASQFHQDTVLRHYPHVQNSMNSNTLLLGGGVGFQSKTVTAPYYGKDSLDTTSKVLSRAFRNHHHERDVGTGLSPRALKQTDFQKTAYPYGVCEVTIL